MSAKKRADNFNLEEKRILANCVYLKKHIVENKNSNTNVTIKEKQKAWESIAIEFNSIAVVKRDAAQLRKAWENIKSRQKKLVAAEAYKSNMVKSEPKLQVSDLSVCMDLLGDVSPSLHQPPAGDWADQESEMDEPMGDVQIWSQEKQSGCDVDTQVSNTIYRATSSSLEDSRSGIIRNPGRGRKNNEFVTTKVAAITTAARMAEEEHEWKRIEHEWKREEYERKKEQHEWKREENERNKEENERQRENHEWNREENKWKKEENERKREKNDRMFQEHEWKRLEHEWRKDKYKRRKGDSE